MIKTWQNELNERQINFTFLDDWSKTAISDLKYEEYSA